MTIAIAEATARARAVAKVDVKREVCGNFSPIAAVSVEGKNRGLPSVFFLSATLLISKRFFMLYGTVM